MALPFISTVFSGMGASTGDPLTVAGTFLSQWPPIYVHYGTGDDANTGLHPDQAKRTLASVAGAEEDGQVIVLMEGHDETLTAAATFTKDVMIVGAGSQGGIPSATLRFDGAGAQLLFTGTDMAYVRNVYFAPRDDVEVTPRLTAEATLNAIVLDGVWMDCSGTTEAAALELDQAIGAIVQNCTFRSVATSVATQSPQAVAHTSGYLVMRNVTFDAGEYGWEGYAFVNNAQKFSAELVSMEHSASSAMAWGTEGDFHTLQDAGPGWLSYPDAARNYRPGLGASAGPLIATDGRIVTTGRAYYVSSVIGNDAYDGRQRKRPFATLQAAITEAVNAGPYGTFIVLAADHDETLTGLVNLNGGGITIIGEGSDGGEPTARLRFDGDGAQLRISSDLCALRNVILSPNKQANASARLKVGITYNVVVDNVVVECDEFDTVGLWFEDAAIMTIRDVTVRAVGTDPETAPGRAIFFDRSYGYMVEELVVDGGATGFTTEAVHMEEPLFTLFVNTELRNGADMSVTMDASANLRSVWMHFSDASESSYVTTVEQGA